MTELLLPPCGIITHGTTAKCSQMLAKRGVTEIPLLPVSPFPPQGYDDAPFAFSSYPTPHFRYFLPQGTTAKLSQLLAKRSATGATEIHAHESELASLRRAVAMLRQELAACKQPRATDGHAFLAAVGHGLPLRRDPSRSNLENAPHRLYKPRRTESGASASGDSPTAAAAGASSAVFGGEGGSADALPATSSDTAGGSDIAPFSMVRSVSTTLRTPHGYVEGAICVESPRRQRVRTSSGMPRSSSTVGMSRPLAGIPMARSPTAPAATLAPADAQKMEE